MMKEKNKIEQIIQQTAHENVNKYFIKTFMKSKNTMSIGQNIRPNDKHIKASDIEKYFLTNIQYKTPTVLHIKDKNNEKEM